MIPNYCVKCGKGYTDNERFMAYATVDGSMTCGCCDHKVWDNPVPVAVCVQPVHDMITGAVGLAIAKRAIEPRLGTWNMLGGHMDNGETVEETAIREFEEETSLKPGVLIGITGSKANGKGHVLVSVEFEPIGLAYWRQAILCPENSEFGVWYPDRGIDLGFPIHALMAAEWSIAL